MGHGGTCCGSCAMGLECEGGCSGRGVIRGGKQGVQVRERAHGPVVMPGGCVPTEAAGQGVYERMAMQQYVPPQTTVPYQPMIARAKPAGQGYEGLPGDTTGQLEGIDDLDPTDPKTQEVIGTPSRPSPWVGVVGEAIGVTGASIVAAIQSQNRLELARIQERIAATRNSLASQAQAGDSAAQQRLAALEAALVNLTRQERPDNTMTYVLIGGGVLAVLGAAYLMTRPRRQNPYHGNPVIVRYGKKRFVPAAELRKRARRRRRARAA